MRILFVGDYSNVHNTLSSQLQKMGHESHVLSDGCGHMELKTDFLVKRNKGILGGARYLYDLFSILPHLKDYDVVQLINPNFLNLRPQKIKYFFDRLKEQNKSIFLTLAGNDYYFVKACYEGKMFRFSEFKVGNKFTDAHKENPHHLYGWLSNPNRIWNEYLYNNITGAMSLLPEYDMAAKDILGERLHFTNLPVDLTELPSPIDSYREKTRILVGERTGAEIWKGTPYLKRIAKEIEKDMPHLVETEFIKDLPFQSYLSRLAQADIILDQLYSYSPAMNALYSMASGKMTVTGGQPEYSEYLNISSELPFISISPFDTDIKERLIHLAEHPEKIKETGRKAREFVRQHNDSSLVASRFLSHWKDLLQL